MLTSTLHEDFLRFGNLSFEYRDMLFQRLNFKQALFGLIKIDVFVDVRGHAHLALARREHRRAACSVAHVWSITTH